MSATKRDYYDVLGVARGASEDDIRKAYRKLARQYHPDLNKEADSESRFKEINEAYEVLGDTSKRSAYDRFGHAAVGGAGGAGAGYSPFGSSPFADIFETFVSNATRGGGRAAPARGSHLAYRLALDFEEAVFGVDRELEITHLETCDKCEGSGSAPGSQPTTCLVCSGSGEVRRVQQSLFGQFVSVMPCERCGGDGKIVTDPCTKCAGEGRVRVTKHLVVRVPAGVDEQSQIRLAGEGDVGPNGAPAGDLYIELSIKPHPLFRRQGSDIWMELPINISQAALGAELTVPTVGGGTAALKVPPGTQHDKVFRLRELGVPHLRGAGRGDQMLRVKVQVPTALTDTQRQLLTELAASFGDDPAHAEDKSFLGRLKDKLTS
ncbi:MAG TPA: molecular chaperone DnaJ [Chloroflexia bacterium]|nr:molecular chaperone DnaJ [Chloroflexia bacterium]